MYEQYLKVRNRHTGEIKLFIDERSVREFLKQNIEWSMA